MKIILDQIFQLNDLFSIILTNRTINDEYVVGTLKGKLKNQTLFHHFQYNSFIPNWMKNKICYELGYDYLHSITLFTSLTNENELIFSMESQFQFELFDKNNFYIFLLNNYLIFFVFLFSLIQTFDKKETESKFYKNEMFS